jgi:hypothetical protein
MRVIHILLTTLPRSTPVSVARGLSTPKGLASQLSQGQGRQPLVPAGAPRAVGV